MLFEFSIAKKYLVPKKKQLSLSLIALMSVGVISLVVWLILVFLSVTDGIEKNWLKKLTSFNAPIQITPTDAYYQSYYYQVDSISGESDFNYKSIGEKAAATLTDPYNPEEDLALPPYWPDREVNADGTTMDFVKLAFGSIERQNTPLIAQDYEVSGALLKLRMLRAQGPSFAPQENSTQSYLTQASYINSFSDKSPHLHSLIDPPRIEDLNHLFYLAELSPDSATADKPDRVSKGTASDLHTSLQSLLENIIIKRMRSSGQKASYLAPILPENQSFDVIAYKKQGRISYLVFSDQERKKSPYFEKGTLKRQNDKLIFSTAEGKF